MNDITQIEQYLAGEMSQEDVQAFELRLQADKSFADTFALYKTINAEMTVSDDEAELKEKLSGLTKKHFADKPAGKVIPITNIRKKWWLYASAAAAVILVLLFLRPGQEKVLTNKQLYARYAVPDELPAVVRGANDDSLLLKATLLFNQRNFALALPLLDSITKQRPGEAQLLLSLGICLVETGIFDKAISLFDSLATKETIYKYDAMVWKGYTFLKQDKKEDCIAALKQIPADAPEYKNAMEIIRMLSKK